MNIYLDNCCFNRPFDDQNQIRIRIETEAKLHLQRKIEEGKLKLVWSYILDYENAVNPFEIRIISIGKWKKKSEMFVTENENIIETAETITGYHIKPKDALHIAYALNPYFSQNKLWKTLSI
ncbi:MAG: hypothetical protein RI575_18400 [Balneolaceae bacterium]|nr:hypothetical protein [Balneolaceae bacterium]